MQHCFLQTIIHNVDPLWVENNGFVNLYTGNENKSNNLTCLFISDDKKCLLYVTNRIFTCDSNTGFPWSQKFCNYYKNILAKELGPMSFSYSGLYFNQYRHDCELNTFKEHMKLNPYNPNMICNYLDKLRDILKFHLLPFCFSEDLLIVDERENIIIPNANYILSITYPLPEDIVKVFKSRLHPFVFQQVQKYKTISKHSAERSIARSGLFSPLKMRRFCTRLIEKEASIDRVYFLCSIIYYFSCIGVCWKLQKQFIQLNNLKTKSKNRKCFGLCLQSTNHIEGDKLKDIIHNFICLEVVQKLPVQLKKAESLYTYFQSCLTDLEQFLRQIDNVSH